MSLERAESQRAAQMYVSMFAPEDYERQHHTLRPAYDNFQLKNVPVPAGATVSDVRTDGVDLVMAGELKGDMAPVLLHFHGGGYLLGSARGSAGLVARLAQGADGACLSVEYRLAPENPFPAALEDAATAYRWLLDQGVSSSRVVLSGESSGGGLAVALALYLRQEGLPLPAGISLISPMADLAITGPSVDEVGDREPAAKRSLLTTFATSYLQGHDPLDPLASPVYGYFEKLPPLLIAVGRNESLFSDSVLIAEAARRDGVEVQLDIYDDTVHVFPMFDFLPEASQAVARIGDFTRHWTATARVSSS
jgi:salicylate hydroxylase